MFGLVDNFGTVGKHLALAAAGLLAVSCSPPTVPAKPDVALVAMEPGPAPERPVKVHYGSLEGRVVAEINAYRARHGRPPFQIHKGLNRSAESHSADMARSHHMSHDGFGKRAKRAQRDGLVWTAENVMWGYGYAEATLAQTIVDRWINSSGHRKNLLRENTHTGVGIARGANGSVWATQLSARTQ